MKQISKEESRLKKCISDITLLQDRYKRALTSDQYQSVHNSIVNIRATLNNMLRLQGGA